MSSGYEKLQQRLEAAMTEFAAHDFDYDDRMVIVVSAAYGNEHWKWRFNMSDLAPPEVKEKMQKEAAAKKLAKRTKLALVKKDKLH
jgi:hypothetical protein